MRSIAAVSVMALAAFVGVPSAHGTMSGKETVASLGRLVSTPCAIEAPAGVASRLRCGRIDVPWFYDRPEVGRFHLSIAIIEPAEPEQAFADPIVWLHGGAGGELVFGAAAIAERPIARRHRVILFDQRGSGESRPQPCPELRTDIYRMMAGPNPAKVGRLKAVEKMDACVADMRRNGPPPEAFGSRQTARDLETIRQALNVQQWNVYGISYGTTLASTYAALYPASVKATVLDSPYLTPRLVSVPQGLVSAISAYAKLCLADPACAARFPDPAGTFAAVSARLERAPLRFKVDPSLGFADDTFHMERVDYETMLFSLLYHRRLYGSLLDWAAGILAGDADKARAMLTAYLPPPGRTGVNNAVNFSINCSENGNREPVLAGKALESSQLTGQDVFRYACDGRMPYRGPNPVHDAQRIPTLVLSGSVDPVTPPPYGPNALKRTGNAASLIVLPDHGHGIERSSACGSALVSAFFADPTRAPNPACIAVIPPIVFSIPPAS
jgi:pimeloyl-ACP methyl ester carboxylesterase